MRIPLINPEYRQNTGPLQKLIQRLNLLIVAFIGGWVLYCGYDIYLYLKSPDPYLTQSAPWYTDILLYSGVMVVIVGIAIALKLAIRKHLRAKEKAEQDSTVTD